MLKLAMENPYIGQGMYREYQSGRHRAGTSKRSITVKALEPTKMISRSIDALAVYLSNHEYDKAAEHGLKAFQLNPNDESYPAPVKS